MALTLINAGEIRSVTESQVTSLTADLAAKALDSSVLHLAGTETATGAKTFNAGIQASSYKSFDGSAGVTQTITIYEPNTYDCSVVFDSLLPFDRLGQGAFTVKNGLIAAFTQS